MACCHSRQLASSGLVLQVAAVLLLAGSASGHEPAALYVISTHHRNSQAGPDELIRMVDGQIVERTPLEHAQTYGASDRRLAIVTSADDKNRLRIWDLKTGRVETDVILGPLPIGFMRPHFGVFSTLLLDRINGQVLYFGMPPVDRQNIAAGRRDSPGQMHQVNAAIDLANGRVYKVEAAAVEPHASWQIVGNDAGLKMIDGGFAVYSPRTHTIAGVKRFPGIADDWFGYMPGLGLCRSKNSAIELLSDADLKPLEQPLELVDMVPGVTWQCLAMPDGRRRRYSLTRYASDGKVAVRGEDTARVELVIHDLTESVELLRRDFALAAAQVWVANDGQSWFLIDRNTRRGVTVNNRTGKTTDWDASWAEEAEMVPYFGTSGTGAR